METETASAPPRKGPRPWLLVLLGLVVVTALVAMNFGGSTEQGPQTSNPARPPQTPAGEQLDAPDVKLEALKAPLPEPGDTDRNPFRFKPKPPPPPPVAPPTKNPVLPPTGPPPPPPPPTVPPIPLKFIGVTEADGVGKIAALTDCKHTVQGVEGEIVDGRYRIVKIGVESLVIEYVDGKGRTTLRAGAPECVTRN